MSAILSRLGRNGRIPAPRRGPTARLAQASLRSTGGIRFTEVLLLAIFGLAVMFTLSTAIFNTKLQISAISHLPFAFLCPVMVLHLVGKAMNRDHVDWGRVFAVTWPMIALALFAFVGSAVAKWELEIDDTYITFATYLFLLPLFVAAVPGTTERLRNWIGTILVIWVAAALVALVGEMARLGNSDIIHEVEYVVVGGFLAWYYSTPSKAFKFVAVCCLVLSVLLNQKLTGYIIALLALLTIAVGAGWRNVLPRWRGTYTTAALIGISVALMVLGLLYFQYKQYLPSGNTEVRLAQYQVAWTRFLQSPIWGSAYLDGSGELYREYVRTLNIPTHSDLLDLLKHGGLLALGLFMWGYYKVFRLQGKALAVSRGDRLLSAYFTATRFFQLTALLTFAINPLLLRGPYLIVIWASLGFAGGAAIQVLREQTVRAS